MALNLLGWSVKREPDSPTLQPAVTAPTTDDGAIPINTSGFFGTYLDLEANYKTEVDLITRYREMAMQPELEMAIDDIVNEAIVHDETGKSVSLVMDDLEQPDSIKELIREEFHELLRLLNFANGGQDLFKRWYIDGRLFYQVIIDQANPKLGIQDLVHIDPRKIKKMRINMKSKDPRTGVEVITGSQDFYLFNDKAPTQGSTVITSPVDNSIKISEDAIVNVNSGLVDPMKGTVLSYLHKAIKPLNLLRMIEDAIVIYRVSRAPERRIFYIDVGGMPKVKAEQYLQSIMTKFRNKVVYDQSTGEIKDDRKFASIMEDYWIPRRGEGKGTEISTLPAGENLGELSDVKYFQSKLYQALNVPVSRLEPQQGFTLGKSSEITRDELKFTKFVERLRSKFSILFDELMQRQLVLKGICSIEEWNLMKEKIHYDFLKDNNFTELKEMELLQLRLQTLQLLDPYVGTYFSKMWVRKKILMQDDDEIESMNEELEEEAEEEAEAMAAQAKAQQAAGVSPDMNTAFGQSPAAGPSLNQTFGKAI